MTSESVLACWDSWRCVLQVYVWIWMSICACMLDFLFFCVCVCPVLAQRASRVVTALSSRRIDGRGQRQGSVGPQGSAGDISCCSSPAGRQLGSAIPAGRSLWQQLPRWQHVSTAPQRRWGWEGKAGGERAGSPIHHQPWWVCQYCLDPGGAAPAVTHARPLQRARTHTYLPANTHTNKNAQK